MHIGESLPQVHSNAKMSESLITMSHKGFGVVAVVDETDHLLGIITDGDLRRHMHENIINMSAAEIMTKGPKTTNPSMLAIEALTIMNDKNITSLLVLDDKKLVGIIHIHDILRAGIS